MLNKTMIALSAAMILASASMSVATPYEQGDDLWRADVLGVTTNRGHTAVVVGGNVVGQDPDANVRARLLRDAHTISR